ncbi:MAG: hypothetical protein SH817_10765 [Leptospira sp.]|nr:hypothetical protein [Leptospira sp.]
MEINLNDSEVKHLLEALVVYEWIVNSPHEESDPSVDNFCQSVFKKLKSAGLKEPLRTTSEGNLSVTEECFQQIHEDYIEAYNDDVFWSDLAFELGTRDISKKYSEAEFLKLSEEEREKKAAVEINAYDKEFETYGIERLYIKN